ncbi:MAG: cyclodeaminase/cyclohydrolase family protein [Clostridiales bacterium]|nr:cyclodeaminase/cyclohydrolase family protein [Clostridiales bacterium]
MKNLSIKEFAEITASKSAVPGGGSIAALCGGLGAALVEMVSNLTIGNKKYAEAEDKMISIKSRALILRNDLLDDIEKDSNAYAQVMNAYKLPKANDEEKKIRSLEIQKGLKTAVWVPLEIAFKSYKVIELSSEVVKLGNKNAVTDGLVSAMMARTATLSALLNVKINLGSIKDELFVVEMSEKVHKLESSCIKEEKRILDSVKL